MDSTARLALQKPNSDPVTGDPVDITVLNANFDKLDSAVSATPCTSDTRPSPFTGQIIAETDTGDVLLWDGSSWGKFGNYKGIGQTFWAVKGNNTTRGNSTVLTDDPDLQIPNLITNATYLMDGFILYYAAPAVDLSMNWFMPAGATMEWSGNSFSASHSGTPSYEGIIKMESRNQSQTQIWGGTGAIVQAMPRGLLRTGGTGGGLKFRWAQQVSSADPAIVYSGSWLRIQRVA